MLRIEAMDHIVLLVDDVERSVAWYRDVLGLEVLRYEEWKNGEVFFPSLRVTAETIIDVFPRGSQPPPTTKNLDHFCLVIAPTDLDALARSGDFDVVDGPGRRWGARGDGQSLYVKDPDGNTVELRHYGDAS